MKTFKQLREEYTIGGIIAVYLFRLSPLLLILSSYFSYNLGQNNPSPKPLPSVAVIACPFGSEYSLTRGLDATVTLRCIEK